MTNSSGGKTFRQPGYILPAHNPSAGRIRWRDHTPMINSLPTPFARLGLPADLCQTLEQLGYEQPSAIQNRSIPVLLEGRDLLGVAQTGTGKTAAFALPILARLKPTTQPAALVLTPTRELCIQVAEAFESYAESRKKIRVLPIYGGQDIGNQLRKLKTGSQIVVGTPGRIMDHIRRRSLDLSALQTLVLDEADEMLRMGFVEDVEWILRHTPENRQTALFSATMPSAIQRISERHQKKPTEIRIESKTRTVERIEQTYIEVSARRKLTALDLVLETENTDGVIVFVRTRNSAQDLATKMQTRGYRCAAIHGELSQRQRELCLQQLKASVIDVLIATDVAARGIDIQRITHVINYDIPTDGESYIHRIGRTGRAGRTGKAILFVTPRERRMLRLIEKTTGQPVTPTQLPTAGQLKTIREQRFAETIRQTLTTEKLDNLRDTLHRIRKTHQLTHEQMALALAFQSQKNHALMVEPHDLDLTPSAQPTNKANRKPTPPSRRNPSRHEHHERHAQKERLPMTRYQLSVGERHAIRISDILGAVANELDIDSRYIGKIQLDKDHSTIELPEGMPDEVFDTFRKIRIKGYPVRPKPLKPGPAPKSRQRKGKPATKQPRRNRSAKNKTRKRYKSNLGKPRSSQAPRQIQD